MTNRPRRGMPVVDVAGAVVGRVETSFPQDGGGDPSFALVRVRRFGGGLKLLPVAAARVEAEALHVPFAAARIDAAPAFEPDRHHHDQLAHARVHWGEHAGDDAGRLGFARLAALRD